MGIRSVLSKPFASYIHKQTVKWSSNPIETQKHVFQNLTANLAKTVFGQEREIHIDTSVKDFQSSIALADYEDLKKYIDLIITGKDNVLWPGKPLYFAKTSGTTSGMKYIPISRESIPYHINSARDALMSYVHETGKSQFLDKKLIFLSGSPILETKGGIHYGRLSGIVNHHVPSYLKGNQLPSYATNCIDDWETKLDTIIDETINSPMGLISGIPPWVQMYFDRIIDRTGKQIKDVFPDFSVFVYGGVNFDPYRKKLFDSIGKTLDSVETYPASEGFIAYQDTQEQEGLLLLLNHGIFYEFIPVEEYFNESPTRLTIGGVKVGVNYAVILNTNAGLWGYSIGDTVKFVSINPYRIIVTGRIKHFISAFGEHVIAEEVEKALDYALQQQANVEVVEFTVAPSINPEKGMSRHEWFVEFANPPQDLTKFINDLDKQLCLLNGYYEDLISGNILQRLQVYSLQKGSFINYMKSVGKLGGQNKVPRLSNDRKIVNELVKYTI